MLTDQLFTRKTNHKKINNTKNWLFKKINKIHGLLSRWTKKKKEKLPKSEPSYRRRLKENIMNNFRQPH